MKIFLIFLLAFATAASAQDTAVKYKVDDNLTITFPGVPDSSYLNGANIRLVRNYAATYLVMVYDTIEFKPLTKEDFEKVMKDFVQGAMENDAAKTFQNKSIADTTLGGAKGKLIFFSKPADSHLGIEKMWFFFTLRDKHCYVLQASQLIDDAEVSNKIRTFLRSAQFSDQPEFMNDDDARAYRFGYNFARITAPLLLLAVVGLLLYFAVRFANRKKRERL